MSVDWGQALLLELPLPLIILVNLADARPEVTALRYLGQAVLLGVPAASMLIGVLDLAESALPGPGSASYAAAGAGFLAGGLVTTAIQFEPLLGWVARAVPIDPRRQVHRLAVVFYLLILITQVVAETASDLSSQPLSNRSLSRADLVLDELPFLLAGFAGVGIWIRRSPRAALERLGLAVPAPWQILAGLAAAGAFYAFGVGMDHLGQVLTPDLAKRVQTTNDALFKNLTDPTGVALIALAAGISEEVLFRGALQPRLGLLAVAILFTAVHTQYGLSVDTVAVLILACGLGLIRRYANTSTSMLCHVVYNGLVGYGIWWLGVGPAVGAEAVLLVGAGLAYTRTRTRAS